jgi:D-inositol-3-phosphate glycosyltransferase
LTKSDNSSAVAVTLLTGGIDKHYTFGLAMELVSKGATVDVIGSSELDCPEFHSNPRMTFLNLRGSQPAGAGLLRKLTGLGLYYAKLIHYAATSKPKIFHILWNGKLEWFDRTLLMLYYKCLQKKVVITAHNVNAGRRDSKNTVANRVTLRMQYRLADHIFVHTEKMKVELSEEFGVAAAAITVIPFGINNSVPKTTLSQREARHRLGIQDSEKAILFFGRISPYKGLEYLVAAFQELLCRCGDYRLIIAGRPENDARSYWNAIVEKTREDARAGRVLIKADHIPDDETELYFKAADVFVLPYRHIYQSGILFLGYSFGLPALVSDVGALKSEIVEGKTGFVFRPEDAVDLANVIERYFASDLFGNLNGRRDEIKDFATARHSWNVVGKATMNVYASLLQIPSSERPLPNGVKASVIIKKSSEAVNFDDGKVS